VETEKWTVDPFGGEVRDGYVYGRGTLDMKSILIGIMEGAETLIGQGFAPKEDVWFAFGGDEERSGTLGAETAMTWFKERNLHFSWLLDEGTPIGVNQIKGVEGPLAMFGIEEKGYMSLDLTVRQKPGHASRPPSVQAAVILGEALIRLSKHPFPFRLTPTVESFFTHLAPLAANPQALVMSHARALGKLFFKTVGSNATIASMLRTTVAMTQLEGSAADNVLPSAVTAVINLRLLHPWTAETALQFIKDAVADERVEVNFHGIASNPVPANPEHAKLAGPGWKQMAAALEEAEPGLHIVPFLMVATTDSRHFKDLVDGIFRFDPLKLNPEEMARVHGHDERVSLENLNLAVRFYTSLLGHL
jgi:carboxypeptidase PM20D1